MNAEQCPDCGATFRPGEPACPECGIELCDEDDESEALAEYRTNHDPDTKGEQQ